jgi:hypothetical protein
MVQALFFRYKKSLEALLQGVLVSFGPQGDRASGRHTVGQLDKT